MAESSQTTRAAAHRASPHAASSCDISPAHHGGRHAARDEVAQWMWEEFHRRDGRLPQGPAAREIHERFGGRHVLATKRDGLSIREPVRRLFRQKCREQGVETIWTWGPQAWRRRRPEDPADAVSVER